MRASIFAELFSCHFGPGGSQGPQAQEVMGQAQTQANAPDFSPAGGGGVNPPAPSQQPPPVWGQQPPPGQDQGYQQIPPKRSPYA